MTTLTNCDSYYSITLTNKTKLTVSVLMKENKRFRTGKVACGKTKDSLNIYRLFPNEAFKIGSAIAEIDNDMPFDKIEVVSNKDTISADNLEIIKSLFDKNFFGGLRTPYNITIK